MPTATSLAPAMAPMTSTSENSRLPIFTWMSSAAASREGGEEGGVAPRGHGAALVVAEAEVGRETAAPDHGSDRAIEDAHEAPRVLTVSVAAHRRLVHADLVAAGGGEGLE